MKRPALPDGEVLAAAELISPRAWGEHYRAGEGPLHYASGPAKRRTLLSEADRLEHLAAAMRMVADYLPDSDDFFDVPARRIARQVRAMTHEEQKPPNSCSNPYCHNGWVPFGRNESGAAPPLVCRVCRRAMPDPAPESGDTTANPDKFAELARANA